MVEADAEASWFWIGAWRIGFFVVEDEGALPQARELGEAGGASWVPSVWGILGVEVRGLVE